MTELQSVIPQMLTVIAIVLFCQGTFRFKVKVPQQAKSFKKSEDMINEHSKSTIIGVDNFKTSLIIGMPLIHALFDQAVQFKCTIGSKKALGSSFCNMTLYLKLCGVKLKNTKPALTDLSKRTVGASLTISAEDILKGPEDDSITWLLEACATFVSLHSHSRQLLKYQSMLCKSFVMVVVVAIKGCS
ncbi:uncharacterized protein MELLADRAFT_114050 [Melampsora larici-populina 98AG31]|uniref:Uncharacterized protein n=1 Tax=Melampsora larici-populina (strain 98AG31 / pathotype 3-4-7) TaxID=747676 RepID=F4SBZ7_MELLP|nr:uncharacterized protein MELLADRAFT_114050 [Melampsora larici-populina 98AG31]EGF97826.1 hypothetical protein MELLADRAFT_114050 [Melampsora larici-populina 98AG31]